MKQPTRVLPIWTIYKNPKDYPDAYVARKFLNDKPTLEIIIAPDLAELRRAVQKKSDYELVRISRAACDDSVIVETWL